MYSKEGYELGNNINSKVLAFAFSLSAESKRNLISQRRSASKSVGQRILDTLNLKANEVQ